MLARLLALVVVLGLSAPAAARAYESPVAYTAVSHNPADALAELPLEDSTYDPATKCSARRKPGMTAFVAWLTRHAEGAFWGTYRCEKWGKRSASLHAEGRAVDWALDVDVPLQRRAAEKLIALFLAPDRLGQPQALARRMGVEEIIWDCSYWGAGMASFRPYSPCLSKRGKLRTHVNKTVAHRDHLHLGLTKAGAAKKTSFWTQR
ncbi:hypothetical protein DVA67_011170 [Solirubrobacter sp. CPCC 204708]|uniref:ARB-07466-like C-terminal domain-containing protein n=1 Tax=Solirubrobacter deserti TaxID=2282478 RepID=A0ABT4RHX5_9ACTN|nr:hypothetical protein [Solirubrobacter deserti]MBE2316539.1 hypothetical protein [Solirubrobacter deserti]MDA0138073.1 hypothetical protein [Solirubrobacter deserti]